MPNDLFKPGKQPPAQFPLGPDLMKAALGNVGFRTRIAAFQNAFAAWPVLIDAGQFAYSRIYLKRLKEDFAAKSGAVLGVDTLAHQSAIASFDAAILQADTFIRDNENTYDLEKDPAPLKVFNIDAALRAAMELPLGADMVRASLPIFEVVQSLFAGYEQEVRADIRKIIATRTMTYVPVFAQVNVFHYMIAKVIERAYCFDTVRSVAAKFQAQSPPSGPLFRAYTAPTKVPKLGQLTEGYRPADPAKNIKASVWTDFLRQQVPTLVRYRDKSKSQCDTLNRISDYLDQGGTVRAGVVSGQTYSFGLTQWARPEHYLLLLASLPFPSFEAVVFLYWDPDQADTWITDTDGSAAMPINYGFLFAFYEPSADGSVDLLVFSTGCSHDDLMTLSQADGDFHEAFAMRHRYQVLGLWDPINDLRPPPPIRIPK